MPRFYFDTSDGDIAAVDEEGIEFASIDEAQQEATRAIGEMGRDALPDGTRRELAIAVRDEGGRVVMRVTFTLRVERLD